MNHLAPARDEVPFAYLRWALPLAGGIGLLAGVAAALVPEGVKLQKEGGLLENLSVAAWALSALAAGRAALRAGPAGERLLATWLAWVAILAGLRELDLHTQLNPDHLGAWGVRYRLNWWADAAVSLRLKLGWLTAFAAAGALLLYPPLRLGGELWHRLRRGEAVVGLLALAAVFLAIGFAIDDVLRPVRFVSHDTKQLIEETSELIGAGLFVVAVVAHSRDLRRSPGGA